MIPQKKMLRGCPPTWRAVPPPLSSALPAGRPSLPKVSPMCSRLRPLTFALALSAIALVATRDGAVVVAQPKAAPVAAAPQAPALNVAFPLGAPRGQTIELTLTGT